MAAAFQLELEHLISHEASQSVILSDVAGINVPSLHAFLEVLSGNRPEYYSDEVDYEAPLRMSYHVDGDDLAEEAPGLTLSDQSPRSHVAYLQEKADRLHAQ